MAARSTKARREDGQRPLLDRELDHLPPQARWREWMNRVEPPGYGDTMRQWGLKVGNGGSLWWAVIARNKMCATLDLRKPRGRAIAIDLLKESDVLIENFRPGTLEKWGMAPEFLQELNPRLIIARVSGYGQTGPYSARAGFAATAEALAGLRTLTGYPNQLPTRVGLSIGDSLAGIFAALGVLSSIIARQSSGKGQVVDASIAESVLAIMESIIPEYSALGAVRQRNGGTLPGIAPSNLYPTADGLGIVIAANADGLFKRLSEVMGQPDLATDLRFRNHVARGANQLVLDEIISAWTSQRSTNDLVALINDAGVPAAPVNDASNVHDDAHFLGREALVDVHTADGDVRMQGVTPKFSTSKTPIRWAGPSLGEHTAEILNSRLGMQPAEIDSLRKDEVI